MRSEQTHAHTHARTTGHSVRLHCFGSCHIVFISRDAILGTRSEKDCEILLQILKAFLYHSRLTFCQCDISFFFFFFFTFFYFIVIKSSILEKKIIYIQQGQIQSVSPFHNICFAKSVNFAKENSRLRYHSLY